MLTNTFASEHPTYSSVEQVLRVDRCVGTYSFVSLVEEYYAFTNRCDCSRVSCVISASTIVQSNVYEICSKQDRSVIPGC